MNKFRWSVVAIIVVAAVLAVVITFKQNAEKYEIRQARHNDPDNEKIAVMDVTGKINKEDEKEEEIEEQTSDIEQAQYEIGLGPSSTGADVLETMHSMTHQKVVATDKWSNLPMTPENINAVYEFIKDSDIGFMLRKELLRIAGDWKEGNFDNIVEDHNYFWEAQNGNVGKATGVLTPEQEAEFIEENF
ncbi:DUF6241 domain-containing protein [Peribacillus sp. TH27]|uniref:DUF6241 domain-containing protein n=1 Tax=Peribacillus sp. TH27 TaxID=2798484 RepID=UPI0019137578|nr:DUF6241 domain-containing protein [Peribacillus sp. TH27]MBK5458038.1 hypothetical protein [Peribacillus sp. TH27]